MWYISLLSLVFVAVMCPIAVLSKTFIDNFIQRIGLMVLCISCFGRAYTVWQAGYVDELRAWVHIGIAIFALGTLYKVRIQIIQDKAAQFVQDKIHFHRRSTDR